MLSVPKYQLKMGAKTERLDIREPGCDDGPTLPYSSPEWFEPEPWEKSEYHQIPIHECDQEPADFGYDDILPYDPSKKPKKVDYSKYSPDEIRLMIADELAMSRRCGHTAVALSDSQWNIYAHMLECRRAWCPVCGGKKGKVAKRRTKAVRERVDLNKVGLRRFEFTVPVQYRENFQSVAGLNKLLGLAQQTVAKYFGESEKTKYKKNGQVKKYCFGNVLAMGALHVFGDKTDKFHPHIHIIVFEPGKTNLYLHPRQIKQMRQTWKRSLAQSGCKGLNEVDIFYSYLKKDAPLGQKIHRVRYDTRPTVDQRIVNYADQDIQRLCVLELKGYQWIRFWGGMSNCKKAYRENAELTSDDLRELENEVGEKLSIVGMIPEFNVENWKRSGKLIEIREGFYRFILKGGYINFYDERENCKGSA